MKINASENINKPPNEIYEIVNNLGYWLPKVDEDIVSMTKTTDGPVGAGTRWTELLKVPGQTAEIEIVIKSVNPGHSFETEFSTKTMKGTSIFAVEPVEEGTNLTIEVHGTTLPIMGWLMYPMIRMSLSKREKNRLTRFKALAESGELDPAMAEST